jgi:hypothetical protein
MNKPFGCYMDILLGGARRTFVFQRFYECLPALGRAFYQRSLRQFGELTQASELHPPPTLRGLLEVSVRAEESTTKSNLTKAQIIKARYLFIQFVSSLAQGLQSIENCPDDHRAPRHAH